MSTYTCRDINIYMIPVGVTLLDSPPRPVWCQILIPSGAIGAFLRIIAAYYIVYQLGLFIKLKDITKNTLEAVNALGNQATINDIVLVLENGLLEALSYLESNLYMVLTVIAVWIIGGFLLDSGMSRIKEMLPRSVNIALAIVENLAKLSIIALFALIIIHSYNIIGTQDSLAGLADKVKPVFENFPVFFILAAIPLLMTPLRALLLLVYGGSARNRIGSIFILLAGLLYLYILYLVYTLYNPVNVIRDHLFQLLEAYQSSSAPVLDFKEIISIILETTIVALDRSEFIVESLMTANAFLLVGFLLLKKTRPHQASATHNAETATVQG